MSDPVSAPASSAPPCVTVPAERSQWFRDQVHAHDAQLKSYLRGSFPAVRDVDDIVQESYLRIWRRQAAQPIESAKAFLFTIAKRLALGHLRRGGRSPIARVTDFEATDVIDDSPGTIEIACTREEVELLFAAISQLPARSREVYLLRKFEGLSQNDIADRLGISPHTVEVHIGRANRSCEKFLRRRGVIREP